MGNWLWGAEAIPKQTKDEVVQSNLKAYIKSLKCDFTVLTARVSTLTDDLTKHRETHGITPELKIMFNERLSVSRQSQSILHAITAVTEQLHSLYQQNLNQQTTSLLRQSAMIMLKSQNNINSDKTLDIMDNFHSAKEEKFELAQNMYAAVQSDEVDTESTTDAWNAFIGVPSVEPKKAPDVVETPVLPSAPSDELLSTPVAIVDPLPTSGISQTSVPFM